MAQWIYQFWNADDAQDLVEYTLLMAFVMFTIIGLATGFSNSIQGITSVSNSQVTYANSLVNGG